MARKSRGIAAAQHPGRGHKGPIDVGYLKDNLTGQTFGYLTVISYLGRKWWLCRCDACGYSVSKRGIDLIRGKLKSCGCRQRVRLTNAVY